MDVDGNGKLSKLEVSEALKATLPVDTEELDKHLDELWMRWDVVGDGELSFEEIMAPSKGLMAYLRLAKNPDQLRETLSFSQPPPEPSAPPLVPPSAPPPSYVPGVPPQSVAGAFFLLPLAPALPCLALDECSPLVGFSTADRCWPDPRPQDEPTSVVRVLGQG